VPVLAFDRECHRLGRVGGYYDRYLPGCRGTSVGLACDWQILERLRREAHDAPLDCVATEKSFTIGPEDGPGENQAGRISVRTANLGKYVVLLLLSLMFLGMISREQLWLQTILNLVFVRASHCSPSTRPAPSASARRDSPGDMENRRAEGGAVDPAVSAKVYRPANAVTGFIVAALPLA
jgi:hypothetical protein